MTAPIAFIDTETLGLDPDHHPVWEVGLILPDGTEHCWQVQVTPRELALAHPAALKISGFHDRYEVDVEPVSKYLMAYVLQEWIPEGTHLAGNVVSFDEERLRRLLWAHDFDPPWHYHLVDVEAFAAGAVGMQPPWKSEDLSYLVGVEPRDYERHTALGDARWARDLYFAAMEATNQ